MSCSVPLSIDPVTGHLTGTPNIEGTYLVLVCCHEWRAGVQISTTQRAFEFMVISCATSVGSILPQGTACSISPNPVTAALSISSTALVHEVSVINTLGQMVLSGVFDKPEVQLSVSDLLPGTYFVRINGNEVHRFIKQ